MRCRRPLRALSKAWDAVQVELKGEYAPDRVLELHEYTASTPWWRIVAVILLTPVPSLVYICLPETVNLAPASLGMARNQTFFARFFLSYSMWCLLQTHMISSRMPLLSLSKLKLVVSAVLVAAASTGVELLYAWRIGFPVPFTIHMMAVPYVSLMFLSLAVMWYPHVRRDLGLLWKIADAILICVCHGLVIIGYPLFYCAFMKIKPGIASAAFSLVLPVLKIFGRLLFYYLCRSAAGDRITITVVFNADLINALFVNFCMQYQPSLMTTAGLMLANAAQVLLMIQDIDSIRYRIAETQKQIIQLATSNNNPADRPGPRSALLTVSMLPRAVDIFQRYSFSDATKSTSNTPATATAQVRPTEPVQGSTSTRGCSWAKWSAITPAHVTSPPSSKAEAGPPSAMIEKTSGSSQLEQLERTYASLVRRLMYASEFSILTAFAEVITPIVYSLYLVIISHMPNRNYYTQFVSMDADKLAQTVLNVLLYSLVELTAFVTLNLILKRRLNFSALHQLAFVLDRQAAHVQSSLILWVFYTTQISLDHYGTDYSFEFAWLQGNSTAA